MKLSIIIVNYKAWQHIQNALDTLGADFPNDWEMIVVDNESAADELAHYQRRYPWAKMIGHPRNSGFGSGANFGVKRATGIQLLFMNPDVVATIDEIRALIAEKAAHPEVGIISPKQVGANGQPQKVFDEFPGLLNQSKVLKILIRGMLPGRKPNPRSAYQDLVYCDWVTGSFLLIDRADFDRIDGWSTDYWLYAEDTDLCKRATEAGMRIAYTPCVQVVHEHGGSSRINFAVKTMTKLEVIISKHVYTRSHMHGIHAALTHCFIASLQLSSLTLTTILNYATFGRYANLHVHRDILSGLIGYYWGVLRTETWLSPRAKENQRTQPGAS